MMQRYLAATPPGLIITAGLLWAMQALINSPDHVVSGGSPIPAPKIFGRLIQEEPVKPTPLPTRIDDPVDPPPRPLTRTNHNGGGGLTIPHHRPEPISTGLGRRTVFLPTDGPLVHMVRVQPTYPAIAQAQGLEGFVTVRFDVSAVGQAMNPAVVDSSHRVFEAPALRAAEKFRFRPKVVDGAAVAVSGITYRFRFEMDN